MRPFLCRATTSIIRNYSHCCFSIADIYTNRNYKYQLSNTAEGDPRVTTQHSVKRSFGELYGRFYSAMLHPRNTKQVETVTVPYPDESPAKGRRRRRKRFAERMKNIENNANVEARKRRLHSTEKPMAKEDRVFIEKSTVALTTRFLEHHRLSRELRAEIKRRRHAPPSKVAADEVDLLKRTLRYITTQYYEPPPLKSDPPAELPPTEPPPADPSVADPSVTDPSATDPSATDPSPTDPSPTAIIRTAAGLRTLTLKPTPVPWFSPYLPPFPNYLSPNPAIELNRSLTRLLFTRPPPAALVPKICYNLLTSSSPPNIYTYNVLIEGLTRVRQGSLAHVVFRNLVDGGLGPRGRPIEDTIVRMLNLCVKTGDRTGFDKIAKITMHRNMATWIGRGTRRAEKKREQKRRSRQLFEILISGAARFGDVQQVRVWIRAMARECPDNPRPGLYLTTSLMRMWTEMGDWDRGLRCWRDLARLARGNGEKLDLRAIRQMVKLCRECKKQKFEKKVIATATAKGWGEDVKKPINKTKGLWLRKENKTPHIRGQRDLPEATDTFLPAGLDALMEALKKAWMTEGTASETGEGEEASVATNSAAVPREKPEQVVRWSRKRSSVSDAAKSRIWDDVISRRMDDVRPFEASGGEVREAIARKRQVARGHHDNGQWVR